MPPKGTVRGPGGRFLPRDPSDPSLTESLLDNDTPGGAPSENDAPVNDKPPKGKSHQAKGGRPKRETEMIGRLTQFYGSVGMLAFAFSQADGAVLMQGAADRANELVNVARHHEAMWNVLETLTTGGDYVPLIVGHGAMLMTIMGNHGITLATLTKRAPIATPEPEQVGANGRYSYPTPGEG